MKKSQILIEVVINQIKNKELTIKLKMKPTSDDVVAVLNGNECNSVEATKANIQKTVAQVKRCQEHVQKHIEDNYVEFMPNHSSSDMFMEEAVTLKHEVQHLLATLTRDMNGALDEARIEAANCHDELVEILLGLNVSNRILKIDDLFQSIEDANAKKDYTIVVDLISQLKTLIIDEDLSEVGKVLQRTECFDTMEVKYHVQAHILEQNLKQRFENLVEFSEKQFPRSKSITLKVSKNVFQLQETVMALFQNGYNPMEFCDKLMENVFEPLIVKPVSLEYTEDLAEYTQLTLSYSVKEMGSNLRPPYSKVLENIKLVLNCLIPLNVSVGDERYVFTIIGNHIKDRLLKLLVDECLMNSIPETMDEFQESTVVQDVEQFETYLADNFFINFESDKSLSEYCAQFQAFFMNRFTKELLKNAKELMQRDLQDMTVIAGKNGAEDVQKNPYLIPRCMISKSAWDLVKLMEGILKQPKESEADGDTAYLNILTIILNCYIDEVPTIHKKLLESIPQQSVLLYNNCMLLAHWVTKIGRKEMPTFAALEHNLQATGKKHFDTQVDYQQGIIMDIMKEFVLEATNHSIGIKPAKVVRQCLRQLDLLKNVWLNVLPDNVYNKTFCDLLNNFCLEVIKRILSMEDIPETVSIELTEILDIILEKGPTFFKEKHEVVQIKNWMKLQQLKLILNASLQEITDFWCDGAGILTANYKPEEVKHMIRALFQNTDRRAKALATII